MGKSGEYLSLLVPIQLVSMIYIFAILFSIIILVLGVGLIRVISYRDMFHKNDLIWFLPLCVILTYFIYADISLRSSMDTARDYLYEQSEISGSCAGWFTYYSRIVSSRSDERYGNYQIIDQYQWNLIPITGITITRVEENTIYYSRLIGPFVMGEEVYECVAKK